jgi:hypothetical protein
MALLANQLHVGVALESLPPPSVIVLLQGEQDLEPLGMSPMCSGHARLKHANIDTMILSMLI